MRSIKTLLAAAAFLASMGAAEASAQSSPRAQAMTQQRARAEAGALQDVGDSGVISARTVSTLSDTNSARIYARTANSANAAAPNASDNSAFVRQAGNSNEAYLTQERRNNAAYIAQIGDNHYVDMTQYGNDRTLVLQTRRGTIVREVPQARRR